MAAVCKTKHGYIIQLGESEDARRSKISVGRLAKKQAESLAAKISNLIQYRQTGDKPTKDLQDWLDGLPDGLRKRFEHLGLITPTPSRKWTVKDYVERYIKSRPDVKPDTIRKYRDTQSRLNLFFKNDLMSDVTVAQAKRFRVYLSTTCKLADNSVRRLIGIARQFWNSAIEDEIVVKNPFRGQPAQVRPNAERAFFVSRELAQKVLDACPDNHWRLVFALARFGGLRIPSEAVLLRWQDVNFVDETIVIHSPKTEHHEGGGIRTIPLYPELKNLLWQEYEAAEAGTVYVLSRYNGKWSNVGVHMARIIEAAGLKVWPKLFVNCRSSRATELIRETGGNLQAVCQWMGHSVRIAVEHYQQVTSADLKTAAKEKVMAQAAIAVKTEEKKPDGLVRNLVRQDAGSSRNEPQEKNKDRDISPCGDSNLRKLSDTCCTSNKRGELGGTGLEPVTPSVSSWCSSQLS